MKRRLIIYILLIIAIVTVALWSAHSVLKGQDAGGASSVLPVSYATTTIPGFTMYHADGIHFAYPTTLNSEYGTIEMNVVTKPLGADELASLAGQGCTMHFCLATSSDVGAGQLYTSYAYTIARATTAYTITYVVHTSNGCWPYMGSTDVNAPDNARYRACRDFINHRDTTIMAPINKSIGTFGFDQ
jgi:hypothetical protein